MIKRVKSFIIDRLMHLDGYRYMKGGTWWQIEEHDMNGASRIYWKRQEDVIDLPDKARLAAFERFSDKGNFKFRNTTKCLLPQIKNIFYHVSDSTKEEIMIKGIVINLYKN